MTPTQPSSYLIGREAILALRSEIKARDPRFRLGAFHDRLLSYGTIPALEMPQNCFNHGDGINFSIAAASGSSAAVIVPCDCK